LALFVLLLEAESAISAVTVTCAICPLRPITYCFDYPSHYCVREVAAEPGGKTRANDRKQCRCPTLRRRDKSRVSNL